MGQRWQVHANARMRDEWCPCGDRGCLIFDAGACYHRRVPSRRTRAPDRRRPRRSRPCPRIAAEARSAEQQWPRPRHSQRQTGRATASPMKSHASRKCARQQQQPSRSSSKTRCCSRPPRMLSLPLRWTWWSWGRRRATWPTRCSPNARAPERAPPAARTAASASWPVSELLLASPRTPERWLSQYPPLSFGLRGR